MKNKDYVYSAMLYTYIGFYIICNYYIHTQLQSLWMVFPTASINAALFKIDLGRIESIAQYLYGFRLPNIIFNTLICVSGDQLLSWNMTATVLVSLCLWLIYKIVYCQTKSMFAAVCSVFIFSTLSVTLWHLKTVTIRLPETTYLLLILYFYFKSDDFSIVKYSLLYFFTVFAVLFGGKSIIMYLVILFAVSSYSLYEKKKFLLRYTIYNFALGAIMLFVLFSPRFARYCTSKLPAWVFLNNLSTEMLYKLISEFINNFCTILSNYYTGVIIVLIVVSFCFQQLFFKKIKPSVENAINFLIGVPLAVHFVTSVDTTADLLTTYGIEKTVMTDVMPVFAFLCLKIGFLLPYVYSCFHAMLKAKIRSRIGKGMAGCLLFVLFGWCTVYTVFYGLSCIPMYTPAFLEKAYGFFNIPCRNFDFTDIGKVDKRYIDFHQYVSFHTQVFPSKKILIMPPSLLLYFAQDALRLSTNQQDIDVLGVVNRKQEIQSFTQASYGKNIFLYPLDKTVKSVEFKNFILDIFGDNIPKFSFRKKFVLNEGLGEISVYW